MDPLDLRRLRILRDLEVRGTLSAVASGLGYTPSAVSQQLAVLEGEVGVRLVEKVGRGVRLTDAGRLLARHARVLLSAAETASADLASLTGEVRGTVRAGGLQSATRRVLIPALTGLQVAHPRVRVEIVDVEFEQAMPELRVGTLDLVISDEYDGHPRPRSAGLTFATLHEEPLELVLPKGHPCAAGAGPVALDALSADAWVTSPPGTGLHDLVLGACRARGGFEPDVRHRSNDSGVLLDLVRATGAVTLLPAMIVPAADESLAVRGIAGTPIRRRLVVVTRDTPTAPALATVLAAVEDQVAGLDRQR